MNGNADDHIILKAPALDMPGVGRITLFARRLSIAKEEAKHIWTEIVKARAIVMLSRIILDPEALSKESPVTQEVHLYEGDRLLATLKAGRGKTAEWVNVTPAQS